MLYENMKASDIDPEIAALEAQRAQMREQSRQAAHVATIAGQSYRNRHWNNLEAGWAAERRRAAGLTPEDWEHVETFMGLLGQADEERTVAAYEAVQAYGRSVGGEDTDRANMLYNYAFREMTRMFGPHANRCLTQPDFPAWYRDADTGWIK